MSASLVGSEMCIRDRVVGGPGLPAPARARPFRAPGPKGPWRGLWAQPVSYTHLTLPTICSV
eukprot:6961720-Alexandrium_andersonii.AAC.1